MRGLLKSLLLGFGFSLVALPPAYALLSAVSPTDMDEYNAVASTRAWALAPSNQYRLFVDIYNTADFYDEEPGGVTTLQTQTVLSDTLRPVLTLLWNERFRFQVGLIAQQTFGHTPDISPIDPWVQVLWKPTSSLTAILGDLEIPHEYLPALFYTPNYFLKTNHETGLQLLNRFPHWRDDLFFNYYQGETATQHEEFEFGFTHTNEWKFLNFTYQANWQHDGGDNDPHPINTINDVAQAAGIGVKQQLPYSFIVGTNFYYLDSHFRSDSDTPGLSETLNGNGRYVQVFARWSRLKLIYGYWRGHDYQHVDGDPYFMAENMNQGIIHWDILLSRDFTLFAQVVGYFVGNNDLGISHYVIPVFWLQAAWHFSIPSKGWNVGSEPVTNTERWDEGL